MRTEKYSLMELVKKARTIRRFEEKKALSRDQLYSLASLCSFVPSGRNAQPLRFRLVHSEAEKNAVFPHLRWAGSLKEWDGPAPGERPGGYIVILSSRENNPATDTGIAAQTIQLAAANAGIGCCMMGAIVREEIASVLNIPEEMQVLLVLSLGYPGETVVIEEVDSGSDLTYFRTEDEIHHVPKLKPEEIIL